MGAFDIFDNLVSRKRQVIEQNGPKFGPLGVSKQFIQDVFDRLSV